MAVVKGKPDALPVDHLERDPGRCSYTSGPDWRMTVVHDFLIAGFTEGDPLQLLPVVSTRGDVQIALLASTAGCLRDVLKTVKNALSKLTTSSGHPTHG